MNYRTEEDIEAARLLISPPGDTLLETITHKQMSQTELAARMGRPLKTINEIIKGKAAIMPETAFQLERVLGISADFWIERERNYRLELAAIADSEQLLKAENWAKAFPAEEMKDLGWIEEADNLIEAVANLLGFFAVADVSSFDSYYKQSIYERALKQIIKRNGEKMAATAWIRQGEVMAEKSTIHEYKASRFKQSLYDIYEATLSNDKDAIINIIFESATHSGVKIVITPTVGNVNLVGASRWLHNHPVIQLQNNYSGIGELCFTYFHEAAHILNHDKKSIFVDEVNFESKQVEIEREANSFAKKILLNIEGGKIWNKIPSYTPHDISAFASETNASEPVLNFLLLKQKKISQQQYNKAEKAIDLNTYLVTT
jgi:HTH-type transcriptional regulator / antitoxin HigA